MEDLLVIALSAIFGIGIALLIESWCKIRDQKDDTKSPAGELPQKEPLRNGTGEHLDGTANGSEPKLLAAQREE